MLENGVSKRHSGKKYIYYGDQIILMSSGKTLIYVPFQGPPLQEPIHQYSENLPCDILILDRVWGPYVIKYAFETKVIFRNDDEVDDDHHIII